MLVISGAEYREVNISIQVIKNFKTCSKSNTENINLESSTTHTFLDLSLPLFLFSVAFHGA